MLSLNPVLTINTQLTEIIKLHITNDNKKVEDLSKNIIIKTGLEDHQKILQSYPHMLSGGQRQRVMIAIALVCSPDILIADEPTTALDVTLQLQILELLQDFKKERKMSLILISHDLDLIKKYSDRLISHRLSDAPYTGTVSQTYTYGLPCTQSSRQRAYKLLMFPLVNRCSDGNSKQSTHLEVPQSPPLLCGYLYMLYPYSDGEIWGSEILGGYL